MKNVEMAKTQVMNKQCYMLFKNKHITNKKALIETVER